MTGHRSQLTICVHRSCECSRRRGTRPLVLIAANYRYRAAVYDPLTIFAPKTGVKSHVLQARTGCSKANHRLLTLQIERFR
jgi:hypothetical protein